MARNYIQFENQLKDYNEYITRFNDPENIENAIITLVDTGMSIDIAADVIKNNFTISDEDKTRSVFKIVSDFYASSNIATGQIFNLTDLGEIAMINTAISKLGQAGGSSVISLAVLDLIQILQAWFLSVQIPLGGVYGSITGAVTSGEFVFPDTNSLIINAAAMLVPSSLINLLEQNPGESNIDFCVRKIKAYTEIWAQFIFNYYIQNTKINLYGVNLISIPVVELNTDIQ